MAAPMTIELSGYGEASIEDAASTQLPATKWWAIAAGAALLGAVWYSSRQGRSFRGLMGLFGFSKKNRKHRRRARGMKRGY